MVFGLGLIGLIVNMPMIISIITILVDSFPELVLLAPFQIIVDLYAQAVNAAAQFVEPTIKQWLATIMGREPTLHRHWQHFFVLLSLILIAYLSLVWQQDGRRQLFRKSLFTIFFVPINYVIAMAISVLIGLSSETGGLIDQESPQILIAGTFILIILVITTFLEIFILTGDGKQLRVIARLGSAFWIYWPGWLIFVFPIAIIFPDRNHLILGALWAIISLAAGLWLTGLQFKRLSGDKSDPYARPELAFTLSGHLLFGFVIAAIIIMANMTIIHFTG